MADAIELADDHADPRAAANGTTIYLNRNRVYDPRLERFLQRDPNGMGQALVSTLRSGASPNAPNTIALDLWTHYSNGTNTFGYLASDPINRRDASGLYADYYLPGPSDYITGAIEGMVQGYAINMIYDIEWAIDWSIPDDNFSRLSNDWIPFAMAQGVASAFDIGPWSPLDLLAGTASDRMMGGKKRPKKGGARANPPGNSYKSQYGTDRHRIYAVEWESRGYVSEFINPKHGGKIDAINFDLKVIRELKPRSPSGVQTGLRQLREYKAAMEQLYPGTTWTTVLDVYVAPWHP